MKILIALRCVLEDGVSLYTLQVAHVTFFIAGGSTLSQYIQS